MNGRWLPLLLPTLIALCGVSGTWAVYGERIETAKEVQSQIRADLVSNDAEHTNFVTREILALSLKPIQQDIEYTKQSIRRIENSNWEILKRLKTMNDEPLGAHGR